MVMMTAAEAIPNSATDLNGRVASLVKKYESSLPLTITLKNEKAINQSARRVVVSLVDKFESVHEDCSRMNHCNEFLTRTTTEYNVLSKDNESFRLTIGSSKTIGVIASKEVNIVVRQEMSNNGSDVTKRWVLPKKFRIEPSRGKPSNGGTYRELLSRRKPPNELMSAVEGIHEDRGDLCGVQPSKIHITGITYLHVSSSPDDKGCERVKTVGTTPSSSAATVTSSSARGAEGYGRVRELIRMTADNATAHICSANKDNGETTHFAMRQGFVRRVIDSFEHDAQWMLASNMN